MSDQLIQVSVIAFTFLCLQMSTAIARSIESDTKKDFSGHTYVAPQMLDDRKYATMTFRNDPDLKRTVLSVKIVGPDYNRRECILPPSVKPAKYDSINRISRKHVLLTINALNTDGLRLMPWKLLLVNTDDCTFRYAYDDTLPYGTLRVLTSKNSTDERFTVITHGKNFLFGDPDWSRLFCNPVCRKREPVDFYSSWLRLVSIELATDSIDANLFIVKIMDKSGAIGIRLYDLSRNRTGSPYKELLKSHAPYVSRIIATINNSSMRTIPYQMVIVASSGLSYCLRPSESVLSFRGPLQCLRFREDGTMMFNETVRGYGLPINMQTIPNGFVLFSNKTDCGMVKSCSAVEVAMVTRNSDSKKGVVQIQSIVYEVKCPVMPSSLRVQLNEATNSIKYIEYLCKKDSYITSRIIFEP